MAPPEADLPHHEHWWQAGAADIHRFNGGLFADDPAIDALDLPNRLFVRFGQANNEAATSQHKETLFYLAATYNFAREGDARNSIGLYTLGHIFEQSIVELEKLEADAEGRPSLTEITKRKRDGVYYTPEWVVTRIIEETIDPLFARWKAEAGWPEVGEPSREAASAYWERLTPDTHHRSGLRLGGVPDRSAAASGEGICGGADAALRIGAFPQLPARRRSPR